jgi:hypothetical protein
MSSEMIVLRIKKSNEDKKERITKHHDTDFSIWDSLNISERDHLFNHGLTLVLSKIYWKTMFSFQLTGPIRTKQSKEEK